MKTSKFFLSTLIAAAAMTANAYADTVTAPTWTYTVSGNNQMTATTTISGGFNFDLGQLAITNGESFTLSVVQTATSWVNDWGTGVVSTGDPYDNKNCGYDQFYFYVGTPTQNKGKYEFGVNGWSYGYGEYVKTIVSNYKNTAPEVPSAESPLTTGFTFQYVNIADAPGGDDYFVLSAPEGTNMTFDAHTDKNVVRSFNFSHLQNTSTQQQALPGNVSTNIEISKAFSLTTIAPGETLVVESDATLDITSMLSIASAISNSGTINFASGSTIILDDYALGESGKKTSVTYSIANSGNVTGLDSVTLQRYGQTLTATVDESGTSVSVAQDLYYIASGDSVAVTDISGVSEILVEGTLTGVNKENDTQIGSVPANTIITGSGVVQVDGNFQYHNQTFLENFEGVVNISGGTLYLGNKANQKFSKISSLKLSTNGALSSWGGTVFSRDVELAGGTIIGDGNGGVGVSGDVTVSENSRLYAQNGNIALSGNVDARGKKLTIDGGYKVVISKNATIGFLNLANGTTLELGGNAIVGATGREVDGNLTIGRDAVVWMTTGDALDYDLNTSGKSNTLTVSGVLKLGTNTSANESTAPSGVRWSFRGNTNNLVMAGGKILGAGDGNGYALDFFSAGKVSVTEDSEIAANMTLRGGASTVHQFEVNGEKTLTISGNIVSCAAGARDVNGIFEKIGAGTLILSGSKTDGKDLRISGGTLVAANAFALGTGAVEISSGAQLEIDDEIALNATTINVVLDANASTYFEGASAISGGEGAALASGTQIAVRGDAMALANVLSQTQSETVVLSLLGTSLVSEGVTVTLDSTFESALREYGWNAELGTSPFFGVYLSTSSIPEPSAFGLLAGVGALALVASRRRRNRR